MLKYVTDRLAEKSTWAGILTLAGTAFGVHFAPDQTEAICAAGVAIASAVAIFTKAKA